MLTKRECILQNRKNKMIKHHQYLLKLKEELKSKEMKINYSHNYNITLAKELKRCRFSNRVLRIKLLKLKKELSRKNI